uniref:Conotoxin n=1 Tax=Conus andremenezi TaxID=1077466 RepID=A0A291C256_9COND|nr:conotoxin [Conus andremenezi]
MMRCLPVVILLLLLLPSPTAPAVGPKTKRLRGLTSFRDFGKATQKGLRTDQMECCNERLPCCKNLH